MNTSKNLVLPLVIFLSLLVCVMIQYWGYEHPALGIDDANIYFVYMKHVATGQGFVWNTGGERVEGFTSFLWTVIGALAYKLTPVYFSRILLAILFILTYFTIYQAVYFVRRLNNTTGAIAASDVVILSALLLPLGFVDWNVLSLMETGLWTFLLTTAIFETCRHIAGWKKINLLRLTLLIMAMVITRPESTAYNLLLIGSIFIFTAIEKGWVKSLKTIAVPLLAHIAAFAAITLWRISYFGFPFPNTYYAKVSSSITYNITSSAKYLVVFFYNYPVNIFIVIMLAFFSINIISALKKNGLKALVPEEKIHLFLFAMVTAGLILPLLTGGDHFKYNRFYQPLLPALLAGACNYYCWKKYAGISFNRETKIIPALTTAFACMMFLSSKYSIPDFIDSRARATHYPVIQDFLVSGNGREVAQKMNETFDSTGNYPSVGSLATGGFAFVYNGTTIDLMGLNNVAMAHANPNKVGYRNHASFDKKVFYQQMPDMMGSFYGAGVIEDTAGFVLPENTESFKTDRTNIVYTAYKSIYDDAQFHDAYKPALIRNKKKNFFIFDYFSTRYLQHIDSSKFTVIPLKRRFSPSS